MRLPSLAVALLALPALSAEEPYGWAFCTDPANRLSVSACTAHVLADCDGAADRDSCLAGHEETWSSHDTNAGIADAVQEDASRGGRITLESLAGALNQARPRSGRCSDGDAECELKDTIKRALGNHAMREAQ